MWNKIKAYFSTKNKQERLIRRTLHGFAQAKALADLKKEPWIAVLNVDVDPMNPGQGSFELDWNDLFVEYLRNAGYSGRDPETIVDAWFNDLCRGIVREESEEGKFVADTDYMRSPTDTRGDR